jgi:hypothetical protein
MDHVIMHSSRFDVRVTLSSVEDFSWFRPFLLTFIRERRSCRGGQADECSYPKVTQDGIVMCVEFDSGASPGSDRFPEHVARAAAFVRALSVSKKKFEVPIPENTWLGELLESNVSWYKVDLADPTAKILKIQFDQIHG